MIWFQLRSLDKNNIRIGAISPGLVKTEAIQVFTQNAAVADMIYASSPHIQTNDVTEAVLQIICAKPHVQIHDVVVRHVQEKWNKDYQRVSKTSSELSIEHFSDSSKKFVK